MSTKFRNTLAGLALGALAFGAGGVAQAGLGVDFSPPGSGNIFSQPDSSGNFFEVGYSFTAGAGAVVTGLGTWTDLSNGTGFSQPQAVGLWNSSGTLLASATVTGSEAQTGSAPWVFASIAPLALTKGATYFVASIGGADYTGDFGPATFDSHITYLTDAFGTYTNNASPSLFFPTSTAGLTSFNPGFFGGNVMLAPEPSTWAMMLLGFGGLAFAGYRARKGVALA